MLSRGEVNRSLRSFIVVRGLWGAWGSMVGTNTAVFAGFVLSLGADASDIAFYSAIASILAPVQIISSLFSKTIENKKRWVVWNGVLEALFRGLMISIPFLFVESLHQRMLLIFLVAGLTAGYIYTPFYSSWVAGTVPENIRARFTSRQTIVNSLVGAVVGVMTGRFVDWFPDDEKLVAFVVVFVVGRFAAPPGPCFSGARPTRPASTRPRPGIPCATCCSPFATRISAGWSCSTRPGSSPWDSPVRSSACSCSTAWGSAIPPSLC